MTYAYNMIDWESSDCGEACLCCDNTVNINGYTFGGYASYRCPCGFAWAYYSFAEHENGRATYTPGHDCQPVD